MKNYLFIFLLSAACLVSCKKETGSCQDTDPNKISLDNATIISTGNFIFSSEKNAGGLVKIYKQTNGKYVIGFEQMNYATTSDMNVYLSGIAGLSPSSIKLFSSKSFSGNTYYIIPPGITIEAFKYIVIQNDISVSPAAIALLD